MMRTSVTVASLNIRGVPLTGSRLTARCQAIGAFFEAGDADVSASRKSTPITTFAS
jgi:hypothetical protein